MNQDKYNDLYAGIFILAVGALLFAASFFIPRGAAVDIGSDFMPKVTCGLMTILGICILWSGVNAAKNYKPTEKEKPVLHYKEVFISVVLLFIYMVLMVPVGFLIMTTLYIMAQSTVLAPEKKKAPVKFGIIGLIASAVIYFVFRNVFVLMLPAGILSFLG